MEITEILIYIIAVQALFIAYCMILKSHEPFDPPLNTGLYNIDTKSVNMLSFIIKDGEYINNNSVKDILALIKNTARQKTDPLYFSIVVLTQRVGNTNKPFTYIYYTYNSAILKFLKLVPVDPSKPSKNLVKSKTDLNYTNTVSQQYIYVSPSNTPTISTTRPPTTLPPTTLPPTTIPTTRPSTTIPTTRPANTIPPTTIPTTLSPTTIPTTRPPKIYTIGFDFPYTIDQRNGNSIDVPIFPIDKRIRDSILNSSRQIQYGCLHPNPSFIKLGNVGINCQLNQIKVECEQIWGQNSNMVIYIVKKGQNPEDGKEIFKTDEIRNTNTKTTQRNINRDYRPAFPLNLLDEDQVWLRLSQYGGTCGSSSQGVMEITGLKVTLTLSC